MTDGAQTVASTEIALFGGEAVRVEGDLKDVAARILAAARGSIMELAWLSDAGTGEPLAINPDHVVSLKRGEVA